MTSPHARLRAAVATLALVTASLLTPTLVLAHSELDVPTPADGATVEGTPATIEGTFTEPLDAEASSLELRDATGATLAEGSVDPVDDLRMAIDPVPELAPGVYEVQWQAVAVDGHIERDTWSFTVVAPTPTKVLPTPTPEPSATSAPTPTPDPSEAASPTPAPTPAASPDPGDDPAGGMDVILPIVLGLTIVAVAAVVLIGRRGRTPAG